MARVAFVQSRIAWPHNVPVVVFPRRKAPARWVGRARSALVPQIVACGDLFSNCGDVGQARVFKSSSMAALGGLGGLIVWYWSSSTPAYLVGGGWFPCVWHCSYFFVDAKPPPRKHQPLTLSSLATGNPISSWPPAHTSSRRSRLIYCRPARRSDGADSRLRKGHFACRSGRFWNSPRCPRPSGLDPWAFGSPFARR